MSEGWTLEQCAIRERWCMAQVPEGQENWPKGASWHPMRRHCKRRGVKKINNEWRCKTHIPKE